MQIWQNVNANGTKCKYNKIELRQNANEVNSKLDKMHTRHSKKTKCKWEKMQI